MCLFNILRQTLAGALMWLDCDAPPPRRAKKEGGHVVSGTPKRLVRCVALRCVALEGNKTSCEPVGQSVVLAVVVVVFGSCSQSKVRPVGRASEGRSPQPD